MENIQDSAEAPPRQSYVEQQLSAAITPATEREKLNRSFDAFCEEIDAQGEASPEPVKAPAEPAAVEAAPVKLVTQIALQPTPPPPHPDPSDPHTPHFQI